MKRLVIVALVVCASYSASFARGSFPGRFLSYYSLPTSSKFNSCDLCHTSNIPAVNSYGDCLLNNGLMTDFNAGLAACEGTDSDGDGVTNLQEIEDGTWPADATDFVPVEDHTWGAIKSLYKFDM